MAKIHFERNPSPAKLEVLGVYQWPTWSQGVSTFEWSYDSDETCYILEGEFTVTPRSGEPMEFRRGDLISFPAGLECTWDIRVPVTKHYDLG